MTKLLIEIGSEEIPAGYIIPALEAFRDNLLAVMAKARIDHGSAAIFGTPRRLAILVETVSDVQRAETTVITGPPERVGYDENGKPLLAAEKFAEKAGVALEEITIQETEKGRYLSAVRTEKTLPTADILESVLPEVILSIPFPKSMRWADLSISFARPIISVAALLGQKVLDVTVGDIRSSNHVYGHSFMQFEKITVDTPESYVAILETAGVIPEIQKRRDLLVHGIQACASESGSVLLKDEELVDVVTNLVEYPYPVVGRFDDEFLELPDEVLITAMREHQKYFALRNEAGGLKPMFIAVNNTKARDMALVARGHEKVIRARLADAKFFFRVDLESTLESFTEKLKSVTFQADLGSMYEKTERLVSLAGYLAQAVDPGLNDNLVRAARLCKSDLVSQMVIEFTKLQGIMGRVYALKAGEPADVAAAIEQHYRPVYSGGALPEAMTSKLLAIADKIDTICGCFSVDLIPTGASDPYALRRQSIGILQIILDGSLDISLCSLVDKGVSLYVTDPERKTQVASKVMEFLKNRMINLLVDQGISREAVNAALAVSFDRLPTDLLRIKALDGLRQAPDFEPLSTAFKRVVNIIRKSGAEAGAGIDVSLFDSEAEQALVSASRDVAAKVADHTGNGDYTAALTEIASLRPAVDRFFDDVMVMVDDEAVRKNRLALLASISGLFETIADFSMI